MAKRLDKDEILFQQGVRRIQRYSDELYEPKAFTTVIQVAGVVLLIFIAHTIFSLI